MAHRDTPSRLGHLVATIYGETTAAAFVPKPLPPQPAINVTHLMPSLDRANRALGRLDGVSSTLPDTSLFLYMYVRKEAVLSSQIEGTQSSLSDILLHEDGNGPGIPLDDTKEVLNYVQALDFGLNRLRDGFPFCLRLIRELHAVLLESGRGESKQPGTFRQTQNWVGGTKPETAEFVPPPPTYLDGCLTDFEAFLNNPTDNLPSLVKAGLIHAQFETIHPFLDGNGRIGRLLVALWLCHEGILQEPLLYLSLYFKQNRSTYYRLLQKTRFEGDWESWLEFFLEGVRETADQAAETARRVLLLFEADQKRIESLGRSAGTATRLHHRLQKRPIMSITEAAKDLQTTHPTIKSSVEKLEALGILEEVTGRRRDKKYVYREYVNILNEGAEPL
jgi:Fic family protein